MTRIFCDICHRNKNGIPKKYNRFNKNMCFECFDMIINGMPLYSQKQLDEARDEGYKQGHNDHKSDCLEYEKACHDNAEQIFSELDKILKRGRMLKRGGKFYDSVKYKVHHGLIIEDEASYKEIKKKHKVD